MRARQPLSFKARQRISVACAAAVIGSLVIVKVVTNEPIRSEQPRNALPQPDRLALEDPPTPETVAADPSAQNASMWLTKPILIVDPSREHAEELAKRFRTTGFSVQTAELGDVEKVRTQIKASSAVWLTNAAANATDQRIANHVMASGKPVVLDGDSPAARKALQLRGETRTTKKFMFEGDEIFLDIDAPVSRPTIANLVTLAAIDQSTPALVRAGNVMWSFVRLDEGINLERMPYLGQLLDQEFGIEPNAERRDVDLYLDPDLETNVTLEQLGKRWSAAGVARVYVAAWKFDFRTNTGYDYAEFVRVMHEFDIKVLAWLEWPHVNFSFWSQHPECREKTATGADARIFWREHVALSVPGCFEKAWEETKLVLESAPFDGVNLAELYFEAAGEGPTNAKEYTPYNHVVVNEFKRRRGFDPRLFVDPNSEHYWERDIAGFQAWNDYREELVLEYHAKALRELHKYNPLMTLMVTAIDDRYAPNGEGFHSPLSLGQNIGANTYDIVKLRADVDFEFQVEDPFTMWVEAPDRYSTVGRLYPEVSKDHLVLDINVVNRPTALQSGFSMMKAGGFELATSVASVAESGARLALYASASARLRDLMWIKYAMAGGATTVTPLDEGGSIVLTESPAAFRLRLKRPLRAVTIDGETQVLASPVRYVDVPAGSHRVELKDR